MNTFSPSAWQQITPQSTHCFRKKAWVIPCGPSVTLQGLLVLSRKFSVQPTRFPPPPPLSCSSGMTTNTSLFAFELLSHPFFTAARTFLLKMQIPSGYFLRKPLQLLSMALWVQFKFDRLDAHFCRPFCCGDEARPHARASP